MLDVTVEAALDELEVTFPEWEDEGEVEMPQGDAWTALVADVLVAVQVEYA